MKLKYMFILFTVLLLSGCWDKVELENRGFVLSVGIDKFEGKQDSSESQDRYSVTMAIPNVSNLADGSGSQEDTNILKKGDDVTISAAMRIIDSYSSKKLDYGHTKVCIISEEILKDENLFKEAVDSLERNHDISKKIIILATDKKAEDILDAKSTDDPLIGIFISNFYKTKSSSTAIAFRNDLQSLIQRLRISGDAIIPKITLEKDEIRLGGAALIKDFKFTGWLEDDDSMGYLWTQGDMAGEQVVSKYKDIYVPLRITEQKSSLKFSYLDDKLFCIYDIHVEGSVEEYKFSESTLFDESLIQELESAYENVIKQDITKTWDIFKTEYNMDGFSIKENLKKKNYNLYKQLEKTWAEEFEKMEITPIVKVEVKNTGRIK